MADLALVCRGTRPNGKACCNILGLVTNGLLSIHHKGRRQDGWPFPPPDTVTIECEDCHWQWNTRMPIATSRSAHAKANPPPRDRMG